MLLWLTGIQSNNHFSTPRWEQHNLNDFLFWEILFCFNRSNSTVNVKYFYIYYDYYVSDFFVRFLGKFWDFVMVGLKFEGNFNFSECNSSRIFLNNFIWSTFNSTFNKVKLPVQYIFY